MIKVLLGSLACLLLTACTVSQPPLVHQPMTARPQPAASSLPANGSIFQAGSYRPLFEDRRPAQVGDLLTVQVEERTNTSTSQNAKGERTTNLSSSVNANLNLPFFSNFVEGKLAGATFGAQGKNTVEGSGSSSGATTFNSSITVTVIEVLGNGNLLVSGEKQLRMNSDTEIIRLSGVVNPVDIRPGNVVSSTKLADARIEQQSEGNKRRFVEPGWLSKFFLSVLPF